MRSTWGSRSGAEAGRPCSFAPTGFAMGFAGWLQVEHPHRPPRHHESSVTSSTPAPRRALPCVVRRLAACVPNTVAGQPSPHSLLAQRANFAPESNPTQSVEIIEKGVDIAKAQIYHDTTLTKVDRAHGFLSKINDLIIRSVLVDDDGYFECSFRRAMAYNRMPRCPHCLHYCRRIFGQSS